MHIHSTRLTLLGLGVLTIATLATTPALACGYGAFDPDVETALTGDAQSAAAALDRLRERGTSALPALARYRRMAERQQARRRHYLEALVRGEYESFSAEARQKEIEHVRTFLEWNARRMALIDVLEIRLRGSDLGGEPWQLHWTAVA